MASCEAPIHCIWVFYLVKIVSGLSEERKQMEPCKTLRWSQEEEDVLHTTHSFDEMLFLTKKKICLENK